MRWQVPKWSAQLHNLSKKAISSNCASTSLTSIFNSWRALGAVFVTCAVLLLSSSTTWAQEAMEFYQGARSLGMGGASVATTNDETALLLNPAGLGRLRNFIFTYLDPEIEVGMSTGKVGMDSLSNLYTLDPLVTYLQTEPDMSYRGKAQLFPSIVFPNFGFGVLLKRELSALSSPEGSSVRLSYVEDWAPTLGYGVELWGGVLKLGASGRYVNRKEYHGVLPGTEPEITVEALTSVGTGVGLDAGVLLTAPVQWLPTIGFVARDLTTTTYSMGGGFFKRSDRGEPTPTPESWDVGLSLNPLHGNQVRSVFAVEYRGLNQALVEGENLQRRVHVGWELNLYDQIFVRAGMNQKYWTAGLEISGTWYQFQFASYGEDIGAIPHSREDRRFVLKFAMRL